ncbi:MAG TPA: hypothetical protein VMF89_27625, partial [Polyangiales bacterium]|nr:hypothetical protein [Polyangiales bacterium]
MTTKRSLLVGSAALAVAGLYMIALDRSGTELASADVPDTSASPALTLPPPAPAADTRELSELSKTVAQLQSELTALRAEGKPAVEPEQPPISDEQIQAEHDEYMVGVERAFEREPRDENWATGTTRMLRETVEAEPVMLAALGNIECHSSSCRVEVRDDGSQTFATEFPLMIHQMGAVLP